MSKFFDSLVKKAENVDTAKASEGFGEGVFFTDTGSYSFNGLISGTIYGGTASGKILGLAGEESTGKTFYALEIVKNFLDANPDGGVFYFESEEALTDQIVASRGIDASRLYKLPAPTVESFRTQCLRVLNDYMESEDRKPMLMVLDSLGNLSTNKELTDIATGSDKRDMTRAQLLRGTFRALTIKLGQANVPMIVTNHVYSVIGAYIPTKEMGGGCLVAGTMIRMSDGSTKAIENVKSGDEVTTLMGSEVVTETFEFDDKDVYEIEFSDGYVVRCSEEHQFLVNGEWIQASVLEDKVKSTNALNTLNVADLGGNIDVYRGEIQENLLQTG